MKQYLLRTWKNKVIALMLLMLGWIPIRYDGDATIFVLMSIAAIPLFFANRNYIE